LVHDTMKCELRIFGQRHVAVDVQALCDHLDMLVGTAVAEVIVNQHEFRLGKEDAARIRQERPQASLRELVDSLIRAECLSGVGMVKVRIPENSVGPVDLDISNPCVKRTAGPYRSIVFSYWCGVFTCLLGKEFKAEYVAYDRDRDLLKCRMVPG